MASTAGRFAVMFGGKATAEDGAETCFDETLLLEALGGSILRIHTLAVGPTKPAPGQEPCFRYRCRPSQPALTLQADSSIPILTKGICFGESL